MTDPIITGSWIDIAHLSPMDGIYGSVRTRSSPDGQTRHRIVHYLLGGDALFPPGVSNRAAQEELLKIGNGLLE